MTDKDFKSIIRIREETIHQTNEKVTDIMIRNDVDMNMIFWMIQEWFKKSQVKK